MDTYLIGLDIAKNVFTAHAIDHTGKPLFRKKLSRSELLPFFASISVSTIAMEACGGAHHWARVLQPTCHDLFNGEVECMLEVKDAGDKPWPQDWPTRPRLKRLGSDAVNGCPVNHVGQLDQWMMQVDMVSQWITLGIAVLENTAFPAHRSLRQICREKASYIGDSCKSNTDLSQLRPHGCWAFAIFQRRLATCL